MGIEERGEGPGQERAAGSTGDKTVAKRVVKQTEVDRIVGWINRVNSGGTGQTSIEAKKGLETELRGFEIEPVELQGFNSGDEGVKKLLESKGYRIEKIEIVGPEPKKEI